jgi:transcription initiation factor TFIID subunit 15
MLFQQMILAAAFGAVASAQNNGQNNGQNKGGNNGGNAAAGNDATGTTLSPQAIQSGSFVDGSVNGALKDGQAASATSQNNFINNCVGKTLTNGLQVTAGSCNGIRKL